MDNKSAYWAWAIKNSICVVAWVTLAIMFNKWWIALFSVLFMSDLKTHPATQQFYGVCDKCGEHSPIADNYNDALKFAKENGWSNIKVGDKWEDYRPDCQGDEE